MISTEEIKKRKEKIAPLIVLFVGVHSIMLGIFVYFFTELFYRMFFGVQAENLFFVRQSGVFLFLAGLFYLYPLVDLKKYYSVILLVIVSKIIAVYFLISNAQFTPAPAMIYLAAFFDGLMCVFLILTYVNLKKVYNRVDEGVLESRPAMMADN
jgi:hypothetical protein